MCPSFVFSKWEYIPNATVKQNTAIKYKFPHGVWELVKKEV